MSEWEEFKEWKEKTTIESLEETGVEIIPPDQREELLNKHCKHENAYIVATRPDGYVDCYCPCGVGGICKTLEEFKRS